MQMHPLTNNTQQKKAGPTKYLWPNGFIMKRERNNEIRETVMSVHCCVASSGGTRALASARDFL